MRKSVCHAVTFSLHLPGIWQRRGRGKSEEKQKDSLPCVEKEIRGFFFLNPIENCRTVLLRKSFTGRECLGKKSVSLFSVPLFFTGSTLSDSVFSIYRQPARLTTPPPSDPPFTLCPVPCFTASCSNLYSLALSHTHSLISLTPTGWDISSCLSLSELEPPIWKWNGLHSDTSIFFLYFLSTVSFTNSCNKNSGFPSTICGLPQCDHTAWSHLLVSSVVDEYYWPPVYHLVAMDCITSGSQKVPRF